MKHILIGLLAFSSVAIACRPVSATTNTAQQAKAETRQSLTGYNAIAITRWAKVHYTQSDQSPYYELSNPYGWKELPTVEVKNGVLCIELQLAGYKNIDGYKLPVVHVYGPAVDQIKMNGIGDLTVDDLHTDNHVDIILDGPGDISINRLSTSKNISLNLTGSGDVDLKHTTCYQFHATVRGSGDMDLDQVKCNQLHATVHGSGDISIASTECNTLNTSLNGSGDISIDALTTEMVFAKLNGSGDIKLKGICGQANLTQENSGELDACSLQAIHVKALKSGSGSLKCHAVETLLTENKGGSGHILYTGNPKVTATGKAPRRK